MTAIMISHFLIDLQEANMRMNHQHSLGSMTSVNFERFAGSLVASLPAPFTTEEEGEENDQVQPEQSTNSAADALHIADATEY